MTSDWIACSERMPPLEEVVLAVSTREGIKLAGYYGKDHGWWHRTVTHWQPLPLPPTRAATTGEGA